MYEIEKKIPVPGSPLSIYPFKQMEVGDSFLVPGNNRTAVSVAMTRTALGTTKKFTSRKTAEGIRVWRVS